MKPLDIRLGGNMKKFYHETAFVGSSHLEYDYIHYIMLRDMKRQISIIERIRAGLQNHLQFNILRP